MAVTDGYGFYMKLNKKMKLIEKTTTKNGKTFTARDKKDAVEDTKGACYEDDPKAFGRNIARLIHKGYPQDQAIKIAYSECEQASK